MGSALPWESLHTTREEGEEDEVNGGCRDGERVEGKEGSKLRIQSQLLSFRLKHRARSRKTHTGYHRERRKAHKRKASDSISLSLVRFHLSTLTPIKQSDKETEFKHSDGYTDY